MSISTEIARITKDKTTIRNKFINLGIADSGANLDNLADAADGIANRGAPTAEVKEGEQYSIQPGYYSGGSVLGVSGGGNYNLQAKSVIPTKQQQSVSPDTGYYGLSGVTVAAIPVEYQDVSVVTAAAGDVLANKTIVNSQGQVVAGEMANNGAVSKVLDATAGNQSYTVPAGYHNGSGTVSIVTETKTVDPTKSQQTITSTSGKVLSSVVVKAISPNYVDISGMRVGATQSEVLTGCDFIGLSGVLEEGTMPNRGKVTATIDGLTTTSYTIQSGYHIGSGTVSLDNSIESALAAI